jgi:GcrA cell cycle regulator
MGWTDERVELLKKFWSEGLSASQIAGRLVGVTRNGVIGKVHRLGLSGRAPTSRLKSHRPRVRSQSAKRLMKPRFSQLGNPVLRKLYQDDTEAYVPPLDELVIPPAERKYIQTLTEICCRWPIGDPQETDFHFCGKRKVTDLPYCEFHARRAYQAAQPRRRDREVVSIGPIDVPVLQASSEPQKITVDVTSQAEEAAAV